MTLTCYDPLEDLYDKLHAALERKPSEGFYPCDCYGRYMRPWDSCRQCDDTGIDYVAFDADMAEWQRDVDAVQAEIAALDPGAEQRAA